MMMRGVVCVGLLAIGCGSDGGSDERFGAPLIEDAVDLTLPVSLGGTTRKALAFDDNTVAGAIEKFFLEPGETLSMDPDMHDIRNGTLKIDVHNLDLRMAGADGFSVGAACVTETPAPHPIDLSAVSPALSLTLQIQCRQNFDGGLATGGIVFGHSGDNFSIWESLDNMNGQDHRGYVANVTTDATGPIAYDFMRLEVSGSLDRITAYHATGNIAADKFEIAYASSDPSTTLWCGFQMVSNGTHVYAKGKYLSSMTGGTCANATEFTFCAQAGALTEVAASECASLTSAFTLAAVTQASVAAAGPAITAVLALSTTDGHVTAL